MRNPVEHQPPVLGIPTVSDPIDAQDIAEEEPVAGPQDVENRPISEQVADSESITGYAAEPELTAAPKTDETELVPAFPPGESELATAAETAESAEPIGAFPLAESGPALSAEPDKNDVLGSL